jgi:hypothetical protein
MTGCELDSCGLGQGPGMSSSEGGNAHLGAVRQWECLTVAE